MNEEFCGRIMRNKTVWAFISCFLGFQINILKWGVSLPESFCQNPAPCSLETSTIRKTHPTLRVFLSIFDQTLTAHFLKTDDARTNRFLLLKQPTPKVHDDTISDDTAPSSGSSELIKFKFQTLSTFATVIRFWWDYHHSISFFTDFHKWA